MPDIPDWVKSLGRSTSNAASAVGSAVGSAVVNTPKNIYNSANEINQKIAIKTKDSRIYKENDQEVFKMNDNLISKNLQDLGAEINKYYNKNSKLNRKV